MGERHRDERGRVEEQKGGTERERAKKGRRAAHCPRGDVGWCDWKNCHVFPPSREASVIAVPSELMAEGMTIAGEAPTHMLSVS